MHAALANNRGEINTRKHIGVKDTHAISSNSSPGRDGEENWRGGGRRGGEGRTMHDLKLQRRPPVVSRRVCTWSYAAKNGLSSPSSSLSPPPPPPFIHPSHPSHPSIHPIHPSILSIHPSIHLSVSFHPPGARCITTPAMRVWVSVCSGNPLLRNPRGMALVDRTNEGENPSSLPPERLRLPRCPGNPGLGLASASSAAPFTATPLPRPSSPHLRRAVSLLDATTRPPPRGMDKTRDT